MQSSAMTVTDEAQQIVVPAGSANSKTDYQIQNPTGGNTVYMGGSDVSDTNGLLLGGGLSWSHSVIRPGDAVYLRCAEGVSQAVRIGINPG
jgi:hypothetical protein